MQALYEKNWGSPSTAPCVQADVHLMLLRRFVMLISSYTPFRFRISRKQVATLPIGVP